MTCWTFSTFSRSNFRIVISSTAQVTVCYPCSCLICSNFTWNRWLIDCGAFMTYWTFDACSRSYFRIVITSTAPVAVLCPCSCLICSNFTWNRWLSFIRAFMTCWTCDACSRSYFRIVITSTAPVTNLFSICISIFVLSLAARDTVNSMNNTKSSI